MNISHLSGSAVVALLAVAIASTATFANEGRVLCIAPSSATLIGVQGEQASDAVDHAFEQYLAGPMLSVLRLQSRLPAQARHEAAGQRCTHTLFTTVRHERRKSGFAERVMASAIFSGANQVTSTVGSAGGRVLASATAGAAGSIATAADVRTRDKLAMTWRLEDANGRTVGSGKDAHSAGADGEDLLTPMVERAAAAVMNAASGARP